jgi:hypothetical protein
LNAVFFRSRPGFHTTYEARFEDWAMQRNYDIFKKYPDGMFIWIEAVRDVEAGKERVKELATVSPGEYKLFCQNTREVVVVENSQPAMSR